MKGRMHGMWGKTSGKTHSPPKTFKVEREVREMIGPPRPAALAERLPKVLKDGKLVDPVSWTVMQTGPKQEMAAVAQLKRDGHTAYCPVITKWARIGMMKRIVHVPLFPRYIFAAVKPGACKSLNACLWAKPVALDGGNISFFAGHEVYAISDAQAAGLYDEAKTEAQKIAEFQALMAARMRLNEGDQVMLDDATWGEIRATVLSKPVDQRVFLLMSIFGRATKLTARLDQIRPAA